jgi:hypothetical protein
MSWRLLRECLGEAAEVPPSLARAAGPVRYLSLARALTPAGGLAPLPRSVVRHSTVPPMLPSTARLLAAGSEAERGRERPGSGRWALEGVAERNDPSALQRYEHRTGEKTT